MDTKGIITKAAYELFEEVPFEDITVQVILDRAHVSRRTFYKYYMDKYELMHQYCYGSLEKFFYENYTVNNWEKLWEETLMFISEKRAFFNNVKNVQGPESLWSFLIEAGFNYYKDVKLKNKQRDELTEAEVLINIAVVEGQIAIVKRFIDEEISMSYREVAKLICSLIPEGFTT